MPKPLMLPKDLTKSLTDRYVQVYFKPDQSGTRQIGFPSTELNPLIWKFLWSFDAYTRGKVQIQRLYEVWLLQTLRSATMHSFQLTVFNSQPYFSFSIDILVHSEMCHIKEAKLTFRWKQKNTDPFMLPLSRKCYSTLSGPADDFLFCQSSQEKERERIRKQQARATQDVRRRYRRQKCT